MKLGLIELLQKKSTWELNLDELDYHRTRKRYSIATPQNRGIIIESLVVVLFSRIFGNGNWLGSGKISEYWDVHVDGMLFDIKSTENNVYSLQPSRKQLIQSQFFNEEIRYILASPISWNDSNHSVTICFHDSMILKDGLLSHLAKFDDGQKEFCSNQIEMSESRRYLF